MNLYLYKMFNGSGYITIQNRFDNGTIHHGLIKDVFIGQIKIPFTNYAIALRKKDVTSYSEKGLKILNKIFSNIEYKIEGLNVIRYNKYKERNDTYPIFNMLWIFNTKYDFISCKNPQVFYSKKFHKYAGFSHRGVQLFGIGDMLFDENNDNEKLYYRTKKFRITFVKYLIKYINNPFDFEDLVKSGITSIVPFKCRGSKIINDMQEAYVAASNFAKYLS